MALNIKDALEIVKRAGFDSRDSMNTGKTERRMADAQFEREEQILRSMGKDHLDEVQEQIDFHCSPERMTFAELTNIDDL